MKRVVIAPICAASMLLAASAYQAHQEHSDKKVEAKDDYAARGVTAEADGKRGTIVGYVRDTACMFRVPRVTESTNDCMRQCVRGGAPLGIITTDGVLYHPITRRLPDTDARKELLPYVGRYVRVNGELFERGGSHAVAIRGISVLPKPAK